jgi:ribose transport system substrate-binding protein
MTTLAVFTKNRLNPAYRAARLAADRVAAASGATAVHFVPEKPDNVEQQKVLVEEALRLKPEAVVFVPADDVAMLPDLAKFAAAGIPVIVCINRMDGPCAAFVGSDDVQVGRTAATALFAGLDDKGTIVALDGPETARTCRDRADGLARALAGHPGIELVGRDCGMNLRVEGREAMERLLARHARIDGVWCANDVMAFGALEALDAAGRTAQIVGVNGLAEAIANIEIGRMLASVDFSAYKIATFAAEAAMRHLRGEKLPAVITLPAELIDRANIAAWKAPMEDRPVPAWSEIVR